MPSMHGDVEGGETIPSPGDEGARGSKSSFEVPGKYLEPLPSHPGQVSNFLLSASIRPVRTRARAQGAEESVSKGQEARGPQQLEDSYLHRKIQEQEMQIRQLALTIQELGGRVHKAQVCSVGTQLDPDNNKSFFVSPTKPDEVRRKLLKAP